MQVLIDMFCLLGTYKKFSQKENKKWELGNIISAKLK